MRSEMQYVAIFRKHAGAPMPKVRDILVHVSVSGAVRTRKCHRNSEHSVQPGEPFLLVREAQSLGSKNYCKVCAREILALAKARLEDIAKRLT
jgi:hypothetical protein